MIQNKANKVIETSRNSRFEQKGMSQEQFVLTEQNIKLQEQLESLRSQLDQKSRLIDKQSSQLETLNKEIPLPSERHLQDQEEIEELKMGILEF